MSNVRLIGAALAFGLCCGMSAAQEHGAARNATTLLKHDGNVQALAYSPDGKYLAAVGARPDGTGDVTLWDAAAGTRLMRLQGHGTPVNNLAFSPDGKTLATNDGNHLIIWNVAARRLESKTLGSHFLSRHGIGTIRSGAVDLQGLDRKQPLKTWRSAGAKVERWVLSADGEELALDVHGIDGHKVVVLDLRTMAERRSLRLRATEVECFAFSPDKQCLAIGSQDFLRLWNVKDDNVRVIAFG